MAWRISCCLSRPLLGSNSTQSLSTTSQSQIYWRRTEPRKNTCSLVLGVAATIVIGTIQISDVASVEAAVVESPPRRWSEKRTCPPWLGNSLETIVPENLPRPSAHRRSELIGLAKGGDAPPVGAVVTRANRAGCFSV